MKGKRKKAARLFLLCLGAAAVLTSTVFALPQPSREFFVTDSAGVLSAETKDFIISSGRALEQETTAQVVVATVNSLEGKSVEEYSIELARSWGIGQEGNNNGVLILLAPTERQVRIEVGYGLEGAINDAKTGRLMDRYAVPSFKENDWNAGIRNLYSAVVGEVYEEYGKEAPEGIISEKSDEEGFPWLAGIARIITILAVLILSPLVFRWFRRGGPPGPPTFWGGGFGSHHGGFGGGGFGGGFSGGGFGGGSGGGFSSGGGGSFGGGGSSRGF